MDTRCLRLEPRIIFTYFVRSTMANFQDKLVPFRLQLIQKTRRIRWTRWRSSRRKSVHKIRNSSQTDQFLLEMDPTKRQYFLQKDKNNVYNPFLPMFLKKKKFNYVNYKWNFTCESLWITVVSGKKLIDAYAHYLDIIFLKSFIVCIGYSTTTYCQKHPWFNKRRYFSNLFRNLCTS